MQLGDRGGTILRALLEYLVDVGHPARASSRVAVSPASVRS